MNWHDTANREDTDIEDQVVMLKKYDTDNMQSKQLINAGITTTYCTCYCKYIDMCMVACILTYRCMYYMQIIL